MMRHALSTKPSPSRWSDSWRSVAGAMRRVCGPVGTAFSATALLVFGSVASYAATVTVHIQADRRADTWCCGLISGTYILTQDPDRSDWYEYSDSNVYETYWTYEEVISLYGADWLDEDGDLITPSIIIGHLKSRRHLGLRITYDQADDRIGIFRYLTSIGYWWDSIIQYDGTSYSAGVSRSGVYPNQYRSWIDARYFWERYYVGPAYVSVDGRWITDPPPGSDPIPAVPLPLSGFLLLGTLPVLGLLARRRT